MTAPLIAPVIPPAGRPSARGRRAAGAGGRLPVAVVPGPLEVPQDVLYGFGRIDVAGRVADRAVISALGWRRGDRLILTAEAGMMTGGALALRPQDLDPVQSLIMLREKGETVRWQPVSPTLMAALVRHGEERHAPPGGQLLRYRNGRSITYRRCDGLWVRIGQHLPWVRTQQISTHWIRHTTLTRIERNFGFAIAHAYAGHTDGAGDTGSSTATYVRTTITEVATALAALTGEPQPAHPAGRAPLPAGTGPASHRRLARAR